MVIELPPLKVYLFSVSEQQRPWPRGYKTIFMLNSTEHEISLGHKNKNTNS